MAYIKIKWVKRYPYKYRMKTFWDKRKKMPVPKILKYLGRATLQDIEQYYKGRRYSIK